MNKAIETIKMLNTTKLGRTLQRGLKTFLYAAVASYVAHRVSPFVVDWPLVIETGLLAALGFSVDKGYREFKK